MCIRDRSLWDLGLSELTPESQHHETVSNPGVGTSEQKAYIPLGMGNLQECPGITGLTSEKVGSPEVRAGRKRVLIVEERMLPAGYNCHQRADLSKAMGASKAGVTLQQRAHFTEG